MKIGLCKEIKPQEGRVALTPSQVGELVANKHDVFFEKNCGHLSSYSNDEYKEAGGIQIDSHKDIFEKCQLIIRVKEVQKEEYDFLKSGHIIFAFFHLTASEELTRQMLENHITAIDYEYMVDPVSKKRCVTMSPIAGRLGLLLGIQYLYSINGGKGLLPMGVPGVPAAEITVIGAGDAGIGAIKTAIGLGAKVNIMEISTRRLDELENQFGNKASYYISNRGNLEALLKKSDAIVNCIFWPKLRNDHLIYKKDLALMKKDALIIDISCDINGGIETCKATSHENPVYKVDGINPLLC